jgi:small conductance mechanosensitive channel
MEILQTWFGNIDWQAILPAAFRVVAILIAAWIGTHVLKRSLQRLEKQLVHKGEVKGEPATESEKRVETLIRLIRQAALLAIGVTVALIILRELGIEIGPIIAGAGVLGLAVGIGAQNLVRDLIAGFFIILENQIRVGDVAVINGTGGLVERIKFRTTVLRDLGGVVHVFPNGAITTLSNLTNEWSAYVFDIGVAYKEDTDRVIEIMKEVGAGLKKDPRVGRNMLEEPEIFGVDKFADSSVVIKGRIRTRPIKQWEVGREYLRRIKQAFDREGIEIPFPHRSIYFGEKSRPFDLELLEKITAERGAEDASERKAG